MKIIDAHMHYCEKANFDRIAKEAQHPNNLGGLLALMDEHGVVAGVGMGMLRYDHPDIDRMPIGLDPHFTTDGETPPPHVYCTTGVNPETVTDATRVLLLERMDAELRKPWMVGMKIYAGYYPLYVTDPIYRPFIELTTKHGLPVIVHTGETGRPDALLKYCHPMSLDEAAIMYPDTTFVMAHFGSPFFVDAAQVVRKNENVWADISGILAGTPDIPALLDDMDGFFCQLKTWLKYCGRWDKILYGTDWPLVNEGKYIEFVKAIVPPEHHDKVFYENAKRVFKRIVE